MGPIEILQDIIKIAQAIHHQVGLVQSNQEKLHALAETIQRVVSSLQGLDELPRTQQFKDSLMVLRDCLQETSNFIQRVSQKNKLEQFAFAGKYERQINEFKANILELIPLLHIGLTAQQLIDHEQERQAEIRDRERLIEQQEEFYRRFREEQCQVVGIERGELEEILHRQLASLEERIAQQLRPAPVAKPDFPERLTVNICDLKFEYKLGESDVGGLYHGSWREQPVTIKWVDRIHTEVERKQFMREIKTMSRLHNEHIMPLYGASIEENRLCLLMGRMEKGDLSQNLTTLSLEERFHIAQDLARGLAYLHQEGIMHGAIKPNNVALNRYNQAKWMNFGLVQTRAISLASLPTPVYDNHWQAPELSQRHAKPTLAADVYSFGLLLWALMTGRTPYAHCTAGSVMQEVNAGFREAIPAELPNALKELIAACWHENPLSRPRAEDVVRALNSILLSRPASPTGDELYERAVQAQKDNHDVEALRLYTRASEKNHMKALGSLGLFKLEGKGGAPVNRAEGIVCLERAANGGHVRSMMNLGRIYKKGDTEHSRPDYPKALHWYRQALREEPGNERCRQEVELLTKLLEPTESTYLYTSMG